MAEDHAIGTRRAATWMVVVNQAERLYEHEIVYNSLNSTANFRVYFSHIIVYLKEVSQL